MKFSVKVGANTYSVSLPRGFAGTAYFSVRTGGRLSHSGLALGWDVKELWEVEARSGLLRQPSEHLCGQLCLALAALRDSRTAEVSQVRLLGDAMRRCEAGAPREDVEHYAAATGLSRTLGSNPPSRYLRASPGDWLLTEGGGNVLVVPDVPRDPPTDLVGTIRRDIMAALADAVSVALASEPSSESDLRARVFAGARGILLFAHPRASEEFAGWRELAERFRGWGGVLAACERGGPVLGLAASEEKVYVGKRIRSGCTVYVDSPHGRLLLDPRLKLWCHFPSGGLEWGDESPGSAQLALALLADALGDRDLAALLLHRAFLDDVVAHFPKEGWVLTERQVRDWEQRRRTTPSQQAAPREGNPAGDAAGQPSKQPAANPLAELAEARGYLADISAALGGDYSPHQLAAGVRTLLTHAEKLSSELFELRERSQSMVAGREERR